MSFMQKNTFATALADPRVQPVYQHSVTPCISENSRKLYVADLTNDVHYNFLPEAMMNTVSSYEVAYWL